MIKHILKLIWNKKRSNSLILVEIFLSFLVLFAVLSYVFYNVSFLTKPLGFESEDRWLVYLDNQEALDSTAKAEMKQTLYTELKGMESVESVTFSDYVVPFGSSVSRTGDDGEGFEMSALVAKSDADFAETYGMKILDGRWFSEEDLQANYTCIVVNEKFIDEYYNGKNMVDSIINYNGEHRIVGVMEDFRYQGEFAKVESTVMFQKARLSEKLPNVHLKLQPGTPAVYEEKVNKLIANVTKSNSFVIKNIEQERKRRSKVTWIPMIVLLSICGFLVINVALGLFGVLVYNINKRKGEIGLRRAIGAHSSDIAKQFVMEIIILTLFALFFGVFFAIQAPLFKIGPFRPIDMYYSIGASTFIILFIVLLCSIFPSWQASKINPAIALHDE